MSKERSVTTLIKTRQDYTISQERDSHYRKAFSIVFSFLPTLLGFRVEVEMLVENEEDFPPQTKPITDLKKDFKLLGR